MCAEPKLITFDQPVRGIDGSAVEHSKIGFAGGNQKMRPLFLSLGLCDELRGGMDASQYKDYVLFMLFIKYVTDKYGNSTDFAPPVCFFILSKQ